MDYKYNNIELTISLKGEIIDIVKCDEDEANYILNIGYVKWLRKKKLDVINVKI